MLNPLPKVELDGQLPARLGDPSLQLPSAQEVLAVCAQHLDLPAASAASCIFARWKPGTSLASCWNVVDANGLNTSVVLKRYVSGKAGVLQERERGDGPRVIADRALAAWKAQHDRELPGLVRLADMHRNTRLLHSLGSLRPWIARWATSSLVLLRYKPEHRAVVRLDLDLREGHKHGARSRRFVAARALCPHEARRVLARRALLHAQCPRAAWPAFLGGEARTGLLFEQWIEGRAVARHDFSHSRAAGAVLRGLHALPLPDAALLEQDPQRGGMDLLAREPGLRAAAERVSLPPAARACWVHGDFHPDQAVVRDEGNLALLDLDNLRPGSPGVDLGCWIADQIAGEPRSSFEQAAGELLDGYGSDLDPAVLRRHVAFELTQLAAGALRRLEVGALQRASFLLERALELGQSGVRRP